ncbi:SusE domain-containing protein [Kaistella palustris]|uniref:SusE domain-containing protein n=1 Tax=Kaistella palustris TaxID=493376 RepID=UPI0005517F8E|nr:SusE domain-containing protein [Kaistella palustris]
MKKNIFTKMILALIAVFSIYACSDRDMLTVENQGAPMILDLSAESVVLDGNFANNPAVTLAWQTATYSAPTEVSYAIQASGDAEFTAPYELGTVNQSVRTVTYSAEQLNKAAQAIGLPANVAGKMYLRVISFLGTTPRFLTATSNVTTMMVTPYELVYPSFYLVGDASYVGWTSQNAQLLYKESSFSYIYTYLEQGKSFRFLGQQDWNPINYSIDAPGIKDDYKYFKQVPATISADGEENMKFSGATGIYKITIDAATGKQTLDISASPVFDYDVPAVYMVGTVNGWNEANPLEMTKTATGVFEYTTTLGAGTEFKFLGQKSWGNLEWGNILKDNSGNSGFLGPKGDNGNIAFEGDGSNYKVTVNLKAGTYSIVKL